MKKSIKQLKIGLSAALLLMLPGLAMSNTNAVTPTVRNQPITIDADHQEFSIQNNTITFTGNVVILQEGLKVTADKVVISNTQSQTDQKITAFGKPVRFQQSLEGNRSINGHSQQLDYDVRTATVTLTGKAELTQQDNQISSNKIIYKVNEQQIIAEGNSNNRVKTTIVPNQLN
ncbi:lipopolysaccharide transport periplasmic protein LptA [Zophobihabitans entericus]|uniref:Lipopolysaccharide export system protein LptA n=1 Tax=Zophobihabitans entericus TaxID=1635327 RepID=A0A6G9IDL4_9GAMM|nr:lipopolysaccharide transport periplasmic protein LptA [Zophobihabitans entericus]QIQ22325.1 lipopolysaccharide transport periplasmic protein LptA [Zophobihabitans entericus]